MDTLPERMSLSRVWRVPLYRAFGGARVYGMRGSGHIQSRQMRPTAASAGRAAYRRHPAAMFASPVSSGRHDSHFPHLTHIYPSAHTPTHKQRERNNTTTTPRHRTPSHRNPPRHARLHSALLHSAALRRHRATLHHQQQQLPALSAYTETSHVVAALKINIFVE
jgi:hypothetical protein